MSYINIRNLGVTLGAPLFSGLNLAVNAGDRIGLVAANGRGKSTLFRCITGELEPAEGEITRARGLTIGHVEQNVPPALLGASFHAAVLAALPADQAESQVDHWTPRMSIRKRGFSDSTFFLRIWQASWRSARPSM